METERETQPDKALRSMRVQIDWCRKLLWAIQADPDTSQCLATDIKRVMEGLVFESIKRGIAG
jgi:hypothetical protein